jgi:hypothetical protein
MTKHYNNTEKRVYMEKNPQSRKGKEERRRILCAQQR